MAKKLSINTITAGDIKRQYPRFLTCDTDKLFAQLANDIYDMMHEELTFMEERVIRNASDVSAPLDAMRFMLWHSICAERAE